MDRLFFLECLSRYIICDYEVIKITDYGKDASVIKDLTKESDLMTDRDFKKHRIRNG